MALELFEVTMSGNLGGQFVQNINHWVLNNSSATGAYESAVDLLNGLNETAKFIEGFMECCPAEFTLTSVRCRRIGPTGGPTAILLQAQLVQDTGQRAGTISVSSSAPLLLLLTTNRPNRLGRMFLPGLSETDVANNVLAAGLVSQMDALGVLFRVGDVTPVSGDSYNGVVYRRALAVGDSLTATRVSQTVGTQRRRQKPN